MRHQSEPSLTSSIQPRCAVPQPLPSKVAAALRCRPTIATTAVPCNAYCAEATTVPPPVYRAGRGDAVLGHEPRLLVRSLAPSHRSDVGTYCRQLPRPHSTLVPHDMPGAHHGGTCCAFRPPHPHRVRLVCEIWCAVSRERTIHPLGTGLRCATVPRSTGVFGGWSAAAAAGPTTTATCTP